MTSGDVEGSRSRGSISFSSKIITIKLCKFKQGLVQMNVLTEPGYCRSERDKQSISKKMKFLMRENSQLKEQIDDLKKLLKLNKEALIIAMGPKASTPINSKQKQETTLVSKLLEENKHLARQLEICIKERNDAQNKIYISDRIIQQNIQFEDELASEYESQIENLKANNKTKDFVLHEMEALRMIPSGGRLDRPTYIVYREINNPYNLMSKMNAEQEKNRQWCYDLKKENLELKNNISEQKTTISHLIIELEKLRQILSKKPSLKMERRTLDDWDIESTVIEQHFKQKEKYISRLEQKKLEETTQATQIQSARNSNYHPRNLSGVGGKSLEQTNATLSNLDYSKDRNQILKDNKRLSCEIILMRAKEEKMKIELIRAKILIQKLTINNNSLLTDNKAKEKQLLGLSQQISIYENVFYSHMVGGATRNKLSKSMNMDCKLEGKLILPSVDAQNMIPARGQILEEDTQEDEPQVNISVLDESFNDSSHSSNHQPHPQAHEVQNIQRINMVSIQNRHRRAPSLALSQIPTPTVALEGKGGQMVRESQVSPQEMQLSFPIFNYPQSYYLDDAVSYLKLLSKELNINISKKAKYVFNRLRGSSYANFEDLPVPRVKVNRSLSCPPKLEGKRYHPPPQQDLHDETLCLNMTRGQDEIFGEVDEGYSIDIDFDEFRGLIKGIN